MIATAKKLWVTLTTDGAPKPTGEAHFMPGARTRADDLLEDDDGSGVVE
jgi:hypothetical protein